MNSDKCRLGLVQTRKNILVAFIARWNLSKRAYEILQLECGSSLPSLKPQKVGCNSHACLVDWQLHRPLNFFSGSCKAHDRIWNAISYITKNSSRNSSQIQTHDYDRKDIVITMIGTTHSHYVWQHAIIGRHISKKVYNSPPKSG